MSTAAQGAHAAAQLLLVADGRAPATPEAVALAAAAAGLLGIGVRDAPVATEGARDALPPTAADPPRTWWRRLFGMHR